MKSKKISRGSGGMFSQKFFENWHAVMAILMFFEYFSAKFCLNFLTLNLSASPNMIHFVGTFLIMCAEGVRLIAIEETRNLEKLYIYIKNIFENGWWEDAYPSSYLCGFAPGHKLQKPSKESGIFQSLGTINFVLFY